MATGQKKVVVRMLSGTTHSGYLPGTGFSAREITFLDTAGRASWLFMKDIKLIAYVKDFNLDDLVDPERLGRKTYPARPRGEGLWIRLEFVDGDFVEGSTALGTVFVDSLLENAGLFLTPPDARGNSQRIFVPRTAIANLEFVAVITTAAKRKALGKPVPVRQPSLFEDG